MELALAQAIIEYIHFEIGAKTFFSTHYHELTSLEDSLSFLKNVHVEANVGKNAEEIVFLHKVLGGPSDQSYVSMLLLLQSYLLILHLELRIF